MNVQHERMARTMVREIAPVWHDRFARLILRAIPELDEQFVLDVHCAHGYLSEAILQRLPESTRVLALQSQSYLDQVARSRMRPEWKDRIYFRPGNFDDVTIMGDSSYDLTIANLVLGEDVHDWKNGLRELVRVTREGGEVLVTIPLWETWGEVDDIFAELLADHNMQPEQVMHQKICALRPKPIDIVSSLGQLGLFTDDFIFEYEKFELLFRSGREFLFSAVVENGPLRMWKAILGKSTKPQELFWKFKEAIDTYYFGRVLAVQANAGLIRVRVPGSAMASKVATPKKNTRSSYRAEYWGQFPELDAIFTRHANRVPMCSETKDGTSSLGDDNSDFELDISVELESPSSGVSMKQAADSGQRQPTRPSDVKQTGGYSRVSEPTSGAHRRYPRVSTRQSDQLREPVPALQSKLMTGERSTNKTSGLMGNSHSHPVSAGGIVASSDSSDGTDEGEDTDYENPT